MRNSRLVFVAAPGMPYLVPAIELAKLLIRNHEGLTINFLIMRPPSSLDSYTQSLTSSLPSIQRLYFNILPHHPDDPSHSHSPHPSSLLLSRIINHISYITEFVSNLIFELDSPRLVGFIFDRLSCAMIDLANLFGVPAILYFHHGASFLGFEFHTHTLMEQGKMDTTSITLEDSQSLFAFPGFTNLVPFSFFPAITMDRQWRQFHCHLAGKMKKAKAILMNTFEELEPLALQSISNSDVTVYPVGHMSLCFEGKTKVAEGSEVMKWLDNQLPSSVLFLFFGNETHFKDGNQVTDIATALERSGVHFLWSLRKPPPEGSKQPSSDYSCLELKQVLPERFLEKTREIGRVMGWASRAQILAHKAVGGFVSNCAWNAIMESVYNGVPIATWPRHAEEKLNAFLLVRELKLGVEICLDPKRDVISAERIENGIKEVMEKDSDVRKKVKGMGETCKRDLMGGGSSCSNLRGFIKDMLIGDEKEEAVMDQEEHKEDGNEAHCETEAGLRRSHRARKPTWKVAGE